VSCGWAGNSPRCPHRQPHNNARTTHFRTAPAAQQSVTRRLVEGLARPRGGLGIGGIGVTKLTARGEVYNLPSAARFQGMYSQFRTGMALGDTGNGKLWLKNGDGVVLKLRGDGKGIGLTMGADAVHISFK